MVAGLDANAPASNAPQLHQKKPAVPADIANLVLKILRDKLGDSKTFGENLIFILNRLSILIFDIWRYLCANSLLLYR